MADRKKEKGKRDEDTTPVERCPVPEPTPDAAPNSPPSSGGGGDGNPPRPK